MRVLWKSKMYALLTIFIMLTILPTTLTVRGDPFSDTIISINPVSQTVDPGENFTIDIYCVPGQPIKAFEFRLSFDASLLQADSVVEGNIFSNYTTFFNAGTIDNVSGNIINVYGLILGSGNVSDPGTFVTISFTAKATGGTSVLDFLDVGSWTGVTNETSYVPITLNSGSVEVQGGSSPPSPPPSSPAPPPPPPPMDDEEENNPPETPIKPSGPTYVEMGVEYTYSSSTFDVDGDQIRFMFDWGDGNFSNWSEFVDSNTSVNMSHNWSSISVYAVRVIAQDINGSNSSWSPPLNVTISQAGLGIPPVVIINISGNFSVNETIVFNASGSYDIDGFIVSYIWDFGDGETGSGISPVHVYKQPGKYTVTLMVTDNSSVTYSKSINVNVVSEIEDMGSGEQTIVLPFNLVMVIVGSTIALIVCLAVVFRHRIDLYLLQHQNHKIKRLKKKFKK